MRILQPQHPEKGNSARGILGHQLALSGEKEGIPVSELSTITLKRSLSTRLMMRPLNYYNGGGDSASSNQSESNPAGFTDGKQTLETVQTNGKSQTSWMTSSTLLQVYQTAVQDDWRQNHVATHL
jgi:hypothetical protein